MIGDDRESKIYKDLFLKIPLCVAVQCFFLFSIFYFLFSVFFFLSKNFFGTKLSLNMNTLCKLF